MELLEETKMKKAEIDLIWHIYLQQYFHQWRAKK